MAADRESTPAATPSLGQVTRSPRSQPDLTIQNTATEIHESISKNGLKLRSYSQGVETDRDKQIAEAAIQVFEDKLLTAL